MRYRFATLGVRSGAVMVLAFAFFGDNGWGAEKTNPLPPLEDVRKAVGGYFAKQTDFQPGDILSRGQVEPLLAQLAQMGFVVADRDDIVSKAPADDEFLVSSLRTTPAGRKFMRSIAVYPGAYDRLDRLARLPIGMQTVQDLIRGPGGEKLIEYFTTTAGGQALGQQLSNAPKGKGFNEPTGRIYTVKMLWSRLDRSYATAQEKASRAPPPAKKQ